MIGNCPTSTSSWRSCGSRTFTTPRARRWFGTRSDDSFATCAVTQAGFVQACLRIPQALPQAISVSDAIANLTVLTQRDDHVFLADGYGFVGNPHINHAADSRLSAGHRRRDHCRRTSTWRPRRDARFRACTTRRLRRALGLHDAAGYAAWKWPGLTSFASPLISIRCTCIAAHRRSTLSAKTCCTCGR